MLLFNEIQVSPSQDCFLHNGQILFSRKFLQVLKFHQEGLAAVADETGWFHIDLNGEALYNKRYERAFGYYFGRASVNDAGRWCHLDTKGHEVYPHHFAWCGNFQESLCTVRDFDNRYFHIDLEGNTIYTRRFYYAGDFKDGAACVRLEDGLWQHIGSNGFPIHSMKYLDLGVFHKSFATARDERGWMHIDRNGQPIYQARFRMVEPFYNGQALVELLSGERAVIDEDGKIVLQLNIDDRH